MLGGTSASPPGGNKTSPNYDLSGDGGFGVWVVKTDGNGNKQWENDFGGDANSGLGGLQQIADGGYILAATSAASPGGNKTSPNYGEYDYWLIRVDGDGNKLWENDFGGSLADVPGGVFPAQEGGYFLGGTSWSFPGGNKTAPNYGGADFWVVKTDINGNKLGDYSYGGANDDYLNSLQLTADGGLVMAGYSDSGVGGTKTTPNYGGQDAWIVKVSDVELPVGAPVILVNGNFAQQNHEQVAFTNLAQVTLSSSITNALIFYTLDGTAPTFGSPLYTGPFTVTNSLELQAFASDEDGTSPTVTITNYVDFVPGFTLADATPGGGTVAFDPPLYTGPFLSKSVVTLTATAAPGWTFSHWSGGAAGTNPVCALTMTTNETIQAVFTTLLASAPLPPAAGAVTLNPPSGPYTYGSTVTLSAVPSAGYYFYGWGNPAYGAGDPLELLVTNADSADNALFAALPANNYALTALPAGPGAVTVTPAAAYYPAGATVALTAVPSAGAYFVGWSGAASGSNNLLSVVMNGSKTITANFALLPANGCLLTLIASGSGTVSNSLPLDYYTNGQMTVITALPGAGEVFTGWSGGAGGTQNPLPLTLTSSLVVTANFAAASPPVITVQPQSFTESAGYSASFTVAATGQMPLYYQWRQNGTPIPGATNATCAIPALQTNQAGIFDCLVYNATASVTSSNALLTVNPSYTFVTLAGLAGQAGSVDGTGSAARFVFPDGLAVDTAGNVYVQDDFKTIRKVTPDGVVTTMPGVTFWQAEGDMAVDSTTNLYVADAGANTIDKVTPAGVVTTLAGFWGSGGSVDGTGSSARFNNPIGTSEDGAGNVYVADGGAMVRKVTPTGVVTTLAGMAGVFGSADGTGNTARFYNLNSTAVDSLGNVYVSDNNNFTIRVVTPAGVVTTLAGMAGNAGSADGVGSAARFAGTYAVAVDNAGNVYVADVLNENIRKVTPAGVVTTLAGQAGSPGSAVGVGSATRFNSPAGVAVDAAGILYVVDYGNFTILKGIPSTVYGQPIFIGQPQSQATMMGSNVTFTANLIGNAPFSYQWQLNGVNLPGQTNAALNLFNVQTNGSYTLTVSNALGVATSAAAVLSVSYPYTFITLAGLATDIRSFADGIGSAARFNQPEGVVVDSAGNVYVDDMGNETVRMLRRVEW